MQGSDQIDEIRIDLKEVKGYLKKIILWARILFLSILVNSNSYLELLRSST